MSLKSKRYKIIYSLGAIGLVLYGFFVAQITVIFLLQAMVSAGIMSANSLESTVTQFNAAFLAYGLALGIILGTFTAIRNSAKGLTELLAIKKRPTWSLLYYVFTGYGVYFLLSFALIVVLQLVIPGFNADEKQAVGFDHLNNQFEYIMAFLALVVLAPIIEEAIFRGFLFSQLRKNLHFLWTALLVSLTFGLVHLQWNVGVDVFCLSLVLCYIREKTGTIWVGVGVHMLKNLLAYVILFLQFDIEKSLIRLLN